jgi:hypothetical protein
VGARGVTALATATIRAPARRSASKP